MLFLILTLVAAQAKAAPTLTLPATVGGTTGQAVTITLAGTNLESPTDLYLDGQPLKAKFAGTAATFTVPSVEVGSHALRLATKAGISNLRPFSVDELPEVKATDSRTKKETAQVLSGPCVVVASTTADASDFYKFSVKARQRLTFEVVGHRLGSAIDPVLQLHDAKSGREIAGMYADDTIGLQTDARGTWLFGKDQDILIEVRDTTYRGDLGYRLRVGEFPSAIAPFPLAATEPTAIRFLGTNTAISEHVKSFPALVSPSPRGWGVSVRGSDVPEQSEVEPNDDAKHANVLPIPGGVSALFNAKNDRDCFALTLKTGDKIRVVAESHEFALATEVYIKLVDAAGKEVAKCDPMKMPVTLEYDATTAGTYTIIAEHLNFGWGPTEAYHLVVTRREPDAQVTLAGDAITLPAKLKANIAVLEGYEGPIDLAWVGEDVLSVSAIRIGKPAKVEPKKDDKKRDEPAKPLVPTVEIAFEPKAGAKPGVYFGRLVSTVKGRTPHAVLTTDSLKKEFPNLAVLPAEMNGVIAVVVK